MQLLPVLLKSQTANTRLTSNRTKQTDGIKLKMCEVMKTSKSKQFAYESFRPVFID